MSLPPTILSIQSLNISFPSRDRPNVHAVKNVSMDVTKGQIHGIIGESGSGKSVTFLSLMGLLPQHTLVSGKILFTGKSTTECTDILQMDARKRRQLALTDIAYVFQDPLSALNPSLTIGRQLLECLTIKNIKKNAQHIAMNMLHHVLPDIGEQVFDRYPHELSGGQRQRVLIAMAMIHQPSLLIADEPTTALDPIVRKDILLLLKNLVKEHQSSMVLISHDIQSIAHFCDTISVFYQGALIESNTSASLLQNPQQAYTKALLHCKPSLKQMGYYLPTIRSFTANQPQSPTPLPPITPFKDILLQTDGVIKKYGQTIALQPTDIALHKGSCLGIIGESGSGKSTLAKIMVNLEHADAGNVIRHPDTKPYDIQLVFQDPYSSLNPSLKIGDAIAEIIRIHHPHLTSIVIKKQVVDLLTETGLHPADYDKKPSAFSGGQRQRICIARALAANPQILVCDEAVSALDISVQAQILNLLKKLQADRNLTLVFITHDMMIARYMCDDIMVMYQGKTIEKGPVSVVFNQPQHPYTQRLISHIN